MFEQWKINNDKIIPDGVVDWVEYDKSLCKILIILKEVNSDESGWDLREFIRNGSRSFTWNNITRWVKGIRNLDKNYNWDEIKEIGELDRKKNLSSIAVINLKKETGGKAIANNKRIYKSAFDDSEILKKQVEIYEPDLIICCGTSDAFFDNVYNKNDLECKMTQKGVWYVKDGNRIIVTYNHPEARVSANFLYYPLMDALREIKSNNAISIN